MTNTCILHFNSIDFFNDDARVVQVQFCMDSSDKRMGQCFVEFASAEEANLVRALMKIIQVANLKVSLLIVFLYCRCCTRSLLKR